LAQLGKRHQSFLISGDQAIAVLLNPHLLPAQLFLPLAQRVGVSRCRATAIHFRLDQLRIFQQPYDLAHTN
jgi:hypothetical protein